MNCPTCQHGPLPADAQYCPRCGRAVRIAAGLQAQIKVRQDVQQNLGNVIGVQTQAVHGDVYGDDIYQVQVYLLGSEGRAVDWRSFLKETTPPYKFLSAYTTRDRALFYGRKAQIEEVVRKIGERPLLAVYGPAGVGKTSLLAAGVIPELMQHGALVVRVQEYTQTLEQTVRDVLVASTEQISAGLPEDLTLPALVHSVCQATQGTLILVLDQFERVFEPTLGEEQRATLIEGLAQALRAVEPEFLRLIVTVDTLERLGRLQGRLPRLLDFPFELEPLTLEEARLAIEQPLAVLGHPGGAGYVEDLVVKWLLPDLDALTPDDPGQIQPPQLQIVCWRLYQEARKRRRPPQPAYIDEALYRDLKGAEGIMHLYLDETLARLGEQKSLAKQTLEAMALAGIGPWVVPEQLSLNGATPGQLRAVLDRLVQAELLDHYAVNGQHKYALASPVVAEGVRLRADPEVKRRYQARDDLARVWAEWLAHEGVASRTQLRYLSEAGAYLSPSAVQVLLLLRSALAQDAPVSLWLEQFRQQGRDLMHQLDRPDAQRGESDEDPTATDEAKRLLGLMDDTLPSQPRDVGQSFGRVAWSAVHHPEAVTRQTAALALAALKSDPREALNRLQWALLGAGISGWRRLWRQAELRGALADADPEIEKLNASLPPLDRAGVWLWRAWRRVLRDRHRIAGLTLGGAVGAGLGLGLLRACIGLLAGPVRLVGAQFAMYFFWAAILGAALSLGTALVGYLLLGQTGKTGEPPSIWRAPLHPDRLPAVLAVGLGTLFFGLAHLVVAWFNGHSLMKEPLVAPMGFVVGLGLSLALHDQPLAGWRLGLRRWLLRLGGVALICVLTQAVSALSEDKGPGIVVAWTEGFYKSAFSQYGVTQFEGMALADAALVGVVLVAGMTAGLVLAADWLARWRNLVG
ncbi:MAG: hypothetical protein JSV36_09160 [Anaerolineae bacterium]|nr:MAG: hypothetical protein JSV36_09160 [Anaerolineae bacterium]